MGFRFLVRLSLAHVFFGIRATPIFSRVGPWRSVTFYVGTNISSPSEEGHRWPSQFGQDRFIAKIIFQEAMGFYVDLAANEPLKRSNTWALEHFYGWKGICIEANPDYMWPLLRHRSCKLVYAVAGQTDGEQIDFLFDNEGGLGGIVGDEFDNKPTKLREGRRLTLQTTTLESILRKARAPRIVDYLSLGIEGAEEFVMSKFNFQSYIFRVLTIERPTAALCSVLKSQGYAFVKMFGSRGDMLYVHRSMQKYVKIDPSSVEGSEWSYVLG